MTLRKTLAATGLALLAFGAQASNLVTNGSFESNAQANGTWAIYSNLVGWTAGSKGIELRNNVAGQAQDGNNFVELDVRQNSVMSQNILGTGLVNLSFFYAARPNTGATNGLGFSFGTIGNSTLLAGISNATGMHNWLQYTLNNFQLDADGSTTLSFFANGPSDGLGGSLDNISVNAVSPVPEVETYAMLLAGLGLIGVASRRRRDKALTA
ncbi:MAG: PEP-CTERM sorting domain-containing protein [Pseudomonas sp.]|nr:PEP-CTERM sorting domain-containing protein [Pseudomonas sp.]